MVVYPGQIAAPRGIQTTETSVTNIGSIDDLPDDGLISRLNDIFESYIGIQDNELAISLWETAIKCATLQEMEASVRESELKIFDFPDELIFDLWGIVSDWKKAKKSAEPIGMGGAKIEELN